MLSTVDAGDARRALETEGLSYGRVEAVAEQGWASRAFELDGRHIVRSARNAEIVEAMWPSLRRRLDAGPGR